MAGKKFLFVIGFFAAAGSFLPQFYAKADWCHNFNGNLKLGSRGAEVFHLKTALVKEKVWPAAAVITNQFDRQTFLAVSAFQKKYSILRTGNAGPLTRAKLSKLYGCAPSPSVLPVAPVAAVATSSIKVAYPNGGESLAQGGSYTISWSASGLDKVNIVLINYSIGDQTALASVSATSGQYSWTIPYSIYNGDKYKISIQSGKTSDLSDNYFSIKAAQKIPAPSLTLLSPIGGESWQKEKTYQIRWLFQDLDTIETIILYNYAQNTSYALANNIGASYNSFNWLIQAVPPGDQYKIKIKGCLGAVCYTSESSNYFSVAP